MLDLVGVCILLSIAAYAHYRIDKDINSR
jgi:hypothetical protein